MKSPILNSHGQPMASTLYDATQNSRERRYIPLTADDTPKTNNPFTRRQILGMARYLEANQGTVRGIISDLSLYSVGSGLIPQSLADEKIAKEYEDYWRGWNEIADVTGKFTFNQMQQMASRAIDVDGDVGFTLNSTRDGFPQIGMILAHRIGSNWQDKKYQDGVRVNRFGQPVSYSVLEGKDKYRRISANNFILLHEAEKPDALRGCSNLAHAVSHFRDVDDILRYTKTGVKVDNSVSLAIYNDSGSVNDGTSFIEDGYTKTDTGDLSWQTFQAGQILHLAKGDKVQSFASNKPNAVFNGFLEFLIRDCCLGVGLPFEFVVSPSGITGTAQRFILSKAQRRFEQRQGLLISKLLNRVWGFVISKGVKSGKIPKSKDWFRVRWQTPKKITVDAGRQSNANLQEFHAGLRSLAEDSGERGQDWLELRTQTEREAADLLERAERLSKKYEISMEAALNLLSKG